MITSGTTRTSLALVRVFCVWLACAIGWQESVEAQAPPGNGAVSLSGTQYVSTSTPTDVPVGSSPYTIEVWFRPTSMGVFGLTGWGVWGASNQVTALRLSPSGYSHYWWSSDYLRSTADLSGSWHHLAATFDGTFRTVYLDGVSAGTDVPGVHAVPSGINFGIGRTNTTEYFQGDIGELYIWTVARTQPEIATDMTTPPATNASGLVAMYRFEEGAGTTAADSAGTHFDGTLMNGAQWISNVPASVSLSASSGVTPTVVNQTSPPVTVTIANDGPVAVVVSSIDTTGADASMFVVQTGGTCPSLTPTLSVGQSCTVRLVFAPTTAAPQLKTASLRVVSNAGTTLRALTGVTGATAAAIPTVSEWGMMIMCLLLAAIMISAMRRREV